MQAIPDTGGKLKQRDRKSRQETLTDRGISPQYPHIEVGEYLIDYLFELGPVMYTGEGIAPVNFGEIESWALLTGTPVSPFDAKALRFLSASFVRQANAAKDPKCPSPWEPTMPDREVISDGVEEMFKALQKRQEREK